MSSPAEVPIEERVYQRALRLLTVQHAVAEMAGGRKVDADPGALRDAVMQIRAAVKAVPGAYCVFIGGLAVQEHGYTRWTDDVDVVVDAEHYGEVIGVLRSQGFGLTQNFILKNKDTGALVDCLKEGVRLKNSVYPLPHPSELGSNGGFAKLPKLIQLKLDSGGRMKDLADIVELLKRHPQEGDAIAAQLPDDTMRSEFNTLHQKAKKELE